MSQQALLEVRLDACHGMPPMDARALRFFCRQNVTSADAVRAAELQGRQDRATGVRCMCAFCEGNSNEIGGKERLRQHYAALRHAQLTAAGVDPAKRSLLIEAEINNGAAFQIAPVTVTRTKGASK
ncbi:hypothetical protein [Acidovorax sp. NCPPB 3576]|uniref:hypothetical protein n=1 Tax=Acidovorax sp. NCPPB 3576 TaxID=2940488 RepID=UPI00234BA82D|nr:hypothetical protein [Acidovorax sp. NCPPB 3576]WCM88819.1 hypothetical protein M5C98_01830 [Acidovorax sp. NCPPB 3576]